MLSSRSRYLSVIACIFYCAAVILCSLFRILTVGFTNLTFEGTQIIFPLSGCFLPIIQTIFLILSITEVLCNRRRGIICLFLCYLYMANWLPGKNIYLIEMALLAGLGNFSSKKITCQVWMWSHVIYIIILIWLNQRNLVVDASFINKKTFLPIETGHSYGMGHSNSLGYLILSTALAYWVICQPRKWAVTLLVFEVLAGITLWLTLSRTSSILMALFPFIAFCFQNIEKFCRNHKKRTYAFFFLIPFVFLGVSFFFIWIIETHLFQVQGNFWARFSDIKALHEYGLAVWGGSVPEGTQYILDNIHLWLLSYCGIIPTILYLAFYGWMNCFLIKTNHFRLLSVLFLYLIFGLMENAGIYSVFFVLPLIAFAPDCIENIKFREGKALKNSISRIKREGKKSFSVSLVIFTITYMFLTTIFFWIVSDDWRETINETQPVNQTNLLPEMDGNILISQTLTVSPDRLDCLELTATKQPEQHRGNGIDIFLTDEKQDILASWKVMADDVPDSGTLALIISPAITDARGRQLILSISGKGNMNFWFGHTRSAGRFEIETDSSEILLVNGNKQKGELVIRQKGIRFTPYMDYFWPVAMGIYIIALTVYVWAYVRRRKGNLCLLNRVVDLFNQYRYLLKTLIVRDFRVRYKESFLGVLWSFLNPLLMSFVYWFVFSTIFRNSIDHFIVYVMSGIILFNYFSEASNLGMQAIVGNAGLITKVYMPKYILPLSKALSSAINLAISLIPLLIIMAITGVSFHRSLFLLPLVLLFLIAFCVGIGLILSACMVFFRDTQFLWGILLTIWNFLSPLFYPESIIPARFITLYHMNPMYQYLFFIRTITLGGISPSPVSYFYCALCSCITLIIGLFVFRKYQDRFILYL